MSSLGLLRFWVFPQFLKEAGGKILFVFKAEGKFCICWRQQVFCLVKSHFYVIDLEEEKNNPLLGQSGLALGKHS